MKRVLVSLLLVCMIAMLSSCSSGGSNQVAKTYDEAMNAMLKGDYAQAVKKLETITFYQDSAQLSLYCQAYAWTMEGEYDHAAAELRKLGSYRDAYQSAAYFEARWAENTADTPYRRARAASLYESEELHGFRDSSARGTAIRQALYEEGKQAETEEKWETAADCFYAQAAYEDSTVRAGYTHGRLLESTEDATGVSLARAVKPFAEAGEYQDAVERKEKALKASLEKADSLMKAGKLDEAETICQALGSFCGEDRWTALEEARKAAAEEARQQKIAEADKLLESGKYEEAREIYLEADEPEKAQEALDLKNAALEEARKAAAEEARQQKIVEADKLLESGKYEEAREIYLEADEPEMAQEALYRKAASLAEKGDAEQAATQYLALGTYKDSRGKHFLTGQALAEKEPETAVRILAEDQDYPGTGETLYGIALRASEKENYALSVSVYSLMQGQRDCSLRLKNDLYLYGQQLLAGGAPGQAASVFDSLSGVGSAALYADMARYAAAEKLESEGNYEAAAAAFRLIPDYADAKDRATECRYQLALDRKNEEKYDEAIQIFAELAQYKDSEAQLKNSRYLLAGAYQEKAQWEKAAELYGELEDYADSRTKRMECCRKAGEARLENGEAEKAYEFFSEAGDAEGMSRAAYAAGEKQVTGMNLQEALRWFKLAAELPETAERTAMVAQSLLNMEEDDLSEQFASVTVNSEKSQAVLYALALRSLERKDEEAAMRQMRKAGDNADASERFQSMLNERVETLVSGEKYEDAAYLCATYGDQDRADAILQVKAQKEEEARKRAQEEAEANRQAIIQKADKLLAEGRYEEAITVYTEAGESELAAKTEEIKQKAEQEAQAREEAARLEAQRAAQEAEEAARQEAEKAEQESIRAQKAEAAGLLQDGKYEEAAKIYEALKEPELVKEVIYQQAARTDQPELYLRILDYRDSREQHYLAGKALLAEDPEKAFQILRGDMEYGDTQEILYDLAVSESEKENYRLSSEIFGELSHQPLNPEEPRSDCAMRSLQDFYQYGIQLQEKQEWEAAAAVFDQIPETGRAKARAQECRYAAAAVLEENGKYTQAALAFDKLQDYGDAEQRAKQNRYSAAQKLMESGTLENARKAFEELGDYSDAAVQEKECRYRMAENLLAAGSLEKAKAMYSSLKGYADAETKVQECVYRKAQGLMEQGEYAEAISNFVSVSKYRDAAEQAKACHTALGEHWTMEAERALQKGKTENAISNYGKAYQEYQDAGNQDKMEQMALMAGDCTYSLQDTNTALKWYRLAGEKGKERIFRSAAYAAQTEQYEEAEALAIESDTEEGRALLYRMGTEKLKAGDRETALRLFKKAGDYPDARQQYDAIMFQQAVEKKEAQDYSGALEILGQIPEHEGVTEFARDTTYLLGVQQLENMDPVSALATLEKIQEDSRAKEKIEEIQTLIATEVSLPDGMDPETEKKVLTLKANYVEELISEKKYEDAIAMLETLPQTDENTQWIKKVDLLWAKALVAEDKLKEAGAILLRLGSYPGVQKMIQENPKLIPFVVTPGSTFRFGKYEQDNKLLNGKEEIEWIVLEVQDGKALLLSKHLLDAMPYHTKPENVTWEKSMMRKWLNSEFLENAFSAEEQSAILETLVDNSRNQGNKAWNSKSGNQTKDKVFLLSYHEAAELYFQSDTDRMCSPTKYATAHEALVSDLYKKDGESCGWWWLRSPGRYQNLAANVRDDGSLFNYIVNYDYGCVRPAFWINLESDIF